MSKSMIVLLLLVPLFTQATSFQVSAQENSNEATDEEARYAAEEAKYAAEEARKKKEGKAAADAIELLGATIWSRVYLPDTITDDALVHAGKLIYIEGLTCNSEEITDKGLKYLAGLDVIYNIDLTDCSSITGSGFVHWEDNKINLRKLLLRRTKVDDAGLASLRANLNILDLGETKITDAGLKHLKNLISDEDKRDGIRLNLDELFLGPSNSFSVN